MAAAGVLVEKSLLDLFELKVQYDVDGRFDVLNDHVGIKRHYDIPLFSLFFRAYNFILKDNIEACHLPRPWSSA